MNSFAKTLLLVFLCFSTDRLSAKNPVFTAVDIGSLDARNMEFFLPERPCGLGEPAANRVWWNVQAKRIGNVENCLKETKSLSATFNPDFSDAAWNEGKGDRYAAGIQESVRLLNRQAFAECLENKGRFLPSIEKTVHQVATLKTWVSKYHDKEAFAFSGKGKFSDLSSSSLGATLAQIHFVLGDKISESCRREIEESVSAWLIAPYRDFMNGKRPHGMGWSSGANNWNPVCACNTLIAVCALVENRRERAEIVASLANGLGLYLSAITEDGYCSEGVGYWDYGFNHYLKFSEALRQQTSGAADLCANSEKIKNLALFPANIELEPGVFPAFSDSKMDERLNLDTMCLADLRCGANAYRKEWQGKLTFPVWSLSAGLYSGLDFESPPILSGELKHGLAAYSYFKSAGVAIVRSDSLSFAVKAGHNGECHNHNDVGSYNVALTGAIVCGDPGAPVYDMDNFGSRRYENKMNSSYGHPVPVAGGLLQGTGSEFRGEILGVSSKDGKTTVEMNLKDAYPKECGLEALRRSMTLDKTANAIEMKDSFRFAKANSFGTAFITYGIVTPLGLDVYEISSGDRKIELHFSSDSGEISTKVETFKEGMRYAPERHPVRIGCDFKRPTKEGFILATIKTLASSNNLIQ